LTTPVAATVNDAGELWEVTRELRVEGVVAKLAAALYRPGRRDTAWLKLNHPPLASSEVARASSSARTSDASWRLLAI
jgi:ATP-dependent DNA ligase